MNLQELKNFCDTILSSNYYKSAIVDDKIILYKRVWDADPLTPNDDNYNEIELMISGIKIIINNNDVVENFDLFYQKNPADSFYNQVKGLLNNVRQIATLENSIKAAFSWGKDRSESEIKL